jgi:hypothetical protein
MPLPCRESVGGVYNIDRHSMTGRRPLTPKFEPIYGIRLYLFATSCLTLLHPCFMHMRRLSLPRSFVVSDTFVRTLTNHQNQNPLASSANIELLMGT